MSSIVEQPDGLMHLMTKRRFLPLFLAQFLETFNDNLLKTALIVLITYDISVSAEHAVFLVAMTSVVIMLPYIFSPIAGQIADKYEKSNLVWIIKSIELFAMFLASVGFIHNSVIILMIALFIMGAHSAFFSPVKYALLPQQLHDSELITANAWFESGIFVAILIGTLFGGLLIKYPGGTYWVSYVGMSAATIGLLASFFIPRAEAMDPELRINFNIFTETFLSIRNAKRNEDIWLAMLGIAWFWFIGVTLMNLLPGFVKHMLHAESTVFTLLLAILAVGITVGAALVQHLLKGEPSFKYVPMGLLGVSLAYFSLAFGYYPIASVALYPLKAFLMSPMSWLVILEVFVLAVFAGVLVVPLHAIMQFTAEDTHCSRMIAACNSVSAFFTVIASVFVQVLNVLHLSIAWMWFALGIMNGFLFLLTARFLSEAFLKTFVKWLLKSFYRVEIKGMENYHAVKETMIIISNHVSYLDGMLLCAFLPDRISFAINTYVANRWWLNPFINAMDGFRLDSTNPMSIKKLIRELNARKRCIIFPEGRITATGSLMKIYEGPALVAHKCHAEVLPIRLDGVQFSFFASLKDIFKRKVFPKITITIMPPRKLECDEGLHGSKRREYLGMLLCDMMSELMFDSSDYQKNLFASLLESAKTYDKSKSILEDSSRATATYSDLIRQITAFANTLNKAPKQFSPALLCIEPSINFLVAFFGLQLQGYLPVLVNDLQDIALIDRTLKKTKATLIIISEMFHNDHPDFVDNLNINRYTLNRFETLPHYLKARAFIQKQASKLSPDTPALALFSEGKLDEERSVKGVLVSHQNIQASRFQLSVCLDLNPRDSVFNAYHTFHLFSLVSGMLLPLLNGMRVILYPARIQTHLIPKVLANQAPTLFMADPDDLKRFGEEAYPYEFLSIRYVFADGERLDESLNILWREKFGIRILSGLFSQDISPVYALNTAMQHKPNTVGRILPKIQYRVEPVEGIEDGGRLFVSGPNVMRAWDGAETAFEVIDPWYDTGKLVSFDSNGFMTVLNRHSAPATFSTSTEFY